VDADATLSRGSIELARQGFAQGHTVLQSAYMFGEGAGLRPRIMRIAAAAFTARGLGRGLLGLSDTLRGNGMWFLRSVLEQTPWCAYSLAEDLEYTMLLLRAGHVVRLLPGSWIVGKLATTREGEAQQRMRWEGGRWAIVKAHTGRLLREFLRRPSPRTFDLIMELLIPPMGLLVALQALALLALAFVPGHAWLVVLFGWFLLGLVVVLSVPLAGLPVSLLGALFYVPVYVAWKLLLLPRTLAASRSKRWIRTTR
jgi:cellulose synthase/poly-beta-1,6-N-acetylglucosamine synthase-like glycosyltransferase